MYEVTLSYPRAQNNRLKNSLMNKLSNTIDNITITSNDKQNLFVFNTQFQT